MKHILSKRIGEIMFLFRQQYPELESEVAEAVSKYENFEQFPTPLKMAVLKVERQIGKT